MAGASRGWSWGTIAAFLMVHVGCMAAIWTGVTRRDLLLCLALYALRMFAVTAGYHRYFSHRAYTLDRVPQFIMAFLAQSSLQSGILWWAAKHREHHRLSDQPGDSHSPLQHSWWYSHVGWIFDENGQPADYLVIPDLTRYPELVWLDRQRFMPGLVVGLITWIAFGWSGLVVGFLWSTVLVYHITFCINSVAHLWGSQPYLTGDGSRNNLLLAIFTFGEGWHSNHHFYAAAARQGFRPWEVDLSYGLLCLLRLVGVARDLKQPPTHVVLGQRAPSAAAVERAIASYLPTIDVDGIIGRLKERWRESSNEQSWARWSAELATAIQRHSGPACTDICPEMPRLEALRVMVSTRFHRMASVETVCVGLQTKIADLIAKALLQQSVVPV